ncbi:hypothetical protein N8995_00045 [Planktomarina temperata]|nr:hypothetical protein [Planktomarina temperata]
MSSFQELTSVAAFTLQPTMTLTPTAPAGFPEAQLLISVRTGPLTASLTSIYEDKAAFDRSVEERTRRMAENGHLMDGVVVEEGEVTLFHIK